MSDSAMVRDAMSCRSVGLLVATALLSACCPGIPNDIRSVTDLRLDPRDETGIDIAGLDLDPLLARAQKSESAVVPPFAQDSLVLHGRTDAGAMIVLIVHEKFGGDRWTVYFSTGSNPAHTWSYRIQDDGDRQKLDALMRTKK